MRPRIVKLAFRKGHRALVGRVYSRGGLKWLRARRVPCPWPGLGLKTYNISGRIYCDWGDGYLDDWDA